MPRSPEPQLVAVPDHELNPHRAVNDSDSSSDGDDSEQEVYEVEAIHASRYDPETGSMRSVSGSRGAVVRRRTTLNPTWTARST